MYSPEIEKTCKVCVYASEVKGTITHIKCEILNGYSSKMYTCPKFKYDVLKKNVRRKKDVQDHGFAPEDFSL